ncbi:MAG: thiol:disulfide interchange protein DsbA/DsbL [Nevskia sp.]|nr:thiol:disulfide interchange protein DsbA/DsbL [Nevskia sp.]
MRLLKSLLFAGLAVFAVACSASTDSSAGSYELGKQFQVVREPAPADSKRISVEEFFCFCCPHCYAVDPAIEAWRKKKAADVDFTFVPNTLGRPDGEVQARAFYIAQALGVEDKIHLPLFQAIHEQRMPMAALPAVRDLFTSAAGVKPEDFDQLSSSFVVDANLRKAEGEARSYGIASTPTIVVGGKYSVSGGSPELTKILDFLVDKVRKERKS